MPGTKLLLGARMYLEGGVLGLSGLVAGLLGRRVLGLTLIGDLSLVSAISVNGVGHLLGPAVGKGNVVGAGGLVTIPGLLLSVIVVGVVILDGPVEVILGRSSRVAGLRLVRAGLVGPGKGDSGKSKNSKEGLETK